MPTHNRKMAVIPLNLRCRVEKVSTHYGHNVFEQSFQTLESAYLWALQDAQIQLPLEQRNIYEIGNWEVCSYNFTRDALSLNVRREGFEFGWEGIWSEYCVYTFYFEEEVPLQH